MQLNAHGGDGRSRYLMKVSAFGKARELPVVVMPFGSRLEELFNERSADDTSLMTAWCKRP
ncbi:hypothetical protein Asp14428_47230 [Actinoplanes sp. NBRC 14428]|uniref:Uncharacterized protein n=1 Tax=Pseudosporangium ferrugineum TaxID=439699 RepID=A0A2T0S196_9ACTN|nr:hypothetical protein CLV70_111165 [Pseudosporangium ferrugineum]BCJ53248.1 hypothetical protein Asp14428_47230 [Actinoplanes sp. NBRC 14428]